MKEIQLTLTIEETNQVLDALGNQPFKTVFNLIGKIQNQAAVQLQDNAQVAVTPQESSASIGTQPPKINE